MNETCEIKKTSEEFYLMVFQDTHHAINAEKHLKNKKLPINVIAVPGEISRDCGLSIKVKNNHIEKALQCMKDNGIFGFDYYIGIKNGIKKEYILQGEIKNYQ